MRGAINGGVRIRFDVEGEGPVLVLHHGMTGSAQRWRDTGYVAALRERYRLILLDARGHGRSDKPQAADAYSRHRLAEDVVAVLDALDLERAFFWGHSMGSEVGFTLGRYHPDRVRGLVLTGYHPFPMPVDERRETERWLADLRRGIGAFVAGYEERHGPLPPEARARWLANDGRALSALVETWLTEADGKLAGELARIPTPSLLLAGTREPFVAEMEATAAAMPNATFVPLDGLDHVQTFFRGDLVVPLATAFLDRIAAESD